MKPISPSNRHFDFGFFGVPSGTSDATDWLVQPTSSSVTSPSSGPVFALDTPNEPALTNFCRRFRASCSPGAFEHGVSARVRATSCSCRGLLGAVSAFVFAHFRRDGTHLPNSGSPSSSYSAADAVVAASAPTISKATRQNPILLIRPIPPPPSAGSGRPTTSSPPASTKAPAADPQPRCRSLKRFSTPRLTKSKPGPGFAVATVRPCAKQWPSQPPARRAVARRDRQALLAAARPLALFIGDIADHVVKRQQRRPTDQRAHLGDVGYAPVHVLEAFAVGPVVRRERDLRVRARHL